MKLEEVQIGKLYRCKVSGQITTVKLMRELPKRRGRVQRFIALNTRTQREISVTAARLRCECSF